MRLLFDQGTPEPLRHHLPGHEVATAYERGWGNLQNGDLLLLAERQGFEALITTDQSLKYQQNLMNRRIAIIVLGAASWPRIQKVLPAIVETIASIKIGGYEEILVPRGVR